MNEKYKFFMQRNVNGEWEAPVDIISKFKGMRYLSCSGMNNYGKIKNIYVEEYAESEELRVFIPDKANRESTDIVLSLGFVGESRRDVYDQFVEWISGFKIIYFDNFRNRKAELILVDQIEIDGDDDISNGDTPFIVVKFKFKNIKGKTTKI